MKNILCILLILLIISCGEDNCQDESIECSVQIGRMDILGSRDTIQQPFVLIIREGDDVIFDIIQNGAQCDDISDDETGQRITFSIDPQVEQLEIRDQELSSVNAIHQEFGAWINRGALIDKGYINIRKITEDSWEIKGELEIEPIQFEESIFSFNKVFSR
jgi:hypothetical protein